MLTAAFWKAAAERAVKTFAQALLATLTLSSGPLDVLAINWVGVVSVAVGATVLSLLTSLAGTVSPAPSASGPSTPTS
jgi:hypothetical protein